MAPLLWLERSSRQLSHRHLILQKAPTIGTSRLSLNIGGINIERLNWFHSLSSSLSPFRSIITAGEAAVAVDISLRKMIRSPKYLISLPQHRAPTTERQQRVHWINLWTSNLKQLRDVSFWLNLYVLRRFLFRGDIEHRFDCYCQDLMWARCANVRLRATSQPFGYHSSWSIKSKVGITSIMY